MVRRLQSVVYRLKLWVALSRFAQDGCQPIDNNWIENQIRPIAIGKKLAVRGLSPRGPAGGGCDESAPKRLAQRTGFLSLSERRSSAAADSKKPD